MRTPAMNYQRFKSIVNNLCELTKTPVTVTHDSAHIYATLSMWKEYLTRHHEEVIILYYTSPSVVTEETTNYRNKFTIINTSALTKDPSCSISHRNKTITVEACDVPYKGIRVRMHSVNYTEDYETIYETTTPLETVKYYNDLIRKMVEVEEDYAVHMKCREAISDLTSDLKAIYRWMADSDETVPVTLEMGKLFKPEVTVEAITVVTTWTTKLGITMLSNVVEFIQYTSTPTCSIWVSISDTPSVIYITGHNEEKGVINANKSTEPNVVRRLSSKTFKTKIGDVFDLLKRTGKCYTENKKKVLPY